MRKCHYECLYFSSYSSNTVHFYPAHMILQSVHNRNCMVYIPVFTTKILSKFLFPGIQILISQYFPQYREIANPDFVKTIFPFSPNKTNNQKST